MQKFSKVIVEVNSNFHHTAGDDLFKKETGRYEEYRKKWLEWPKNFHVGEFPLFIDIEVTSSCNLKCPFCATTFRDKFIKKGFISSKTIKKIIDEGADNGLYGIKFNIRGEPLLHPDICSFAAYAKRKGLIDVYFNTNAVLLTGDMAKRIIDSGLDRISISCEGCTKDVFERYRVGAKFEAVLENIVEMQALKKKLNVDHPKIRVQTVMLPEIKNTLENYTTFWGRIADEVGFLDYKEMKTKKKGIQYPWACPQPWQRMAIWWDGTILPCNHDDDGLLSLGNICDMTIKKAWNSQRLNDWRQIHKKGIAHEIMACDGCYLRDSETAKLEAARP